MDLQELEATAQAAVHEVGPLIREAWLREKKVELKGAIDLVTETDREVEEIIVRHIRAAHPGHRIIGEESCGGAPVPRPQEGELAWYVDPIDGTTNFAHGYPSFAVSIAVVRGRERLFGLVHDPVRDETFVARRGEGATLNGAPIRVSSVGSLAGGLLSTGFPYDTPERTDYYVAFFADFLRRVQGIRRCGSAALDLCSVACGRIDGFWEWKLHPWDTAAGALIVTEAGGCVTDFRGGELDPYGEQTLASNALLHDAMMAVLAARLDGA